MKKLTALALVSFVALCTPVLAQDDLTKGEQIRTETTLGVYSQDPSGNQDMVRQYDGRDFNRPGIEALNSMGYKDDFQYFLDARDLIIGDEDIFASMSSKNLFGMEFYTSALTHRLSRIPAINPFLAGTSVAGGDDILDLSPNANFELDRRVTSVLLDSTPTSDQRYRLVGGFWQESESGSRQLLFRARAATPGVIANRARAGVAIPIDRSTLQGSTGIDVKLGNSSVVNYRFASTSFNDQGTRPKTAPLNTVNPISSFTKFNSQTTSNVVKVRSRLNDKMDFTGVYTSKTRESDGTSLAASPKVGINAANAALSFKATDSLSFTGRYRSYKLDNDTALLDNAGLPTNTALSKDVTAYTLDGVYTGLARTYVKFGYERRDTDRSIEPGQPADEEFEHPMISGDSQSNIYRASVRYYPTSRLSFSGSIENSNSDNPGYVSLPTDTTNTKLNATYLITDNFAIYGDYNRFNEKNKLVFVPFANIPARATDDAGEALREEAAGQGYDNDYSTLTLGTWYAISSRLVLDANYGKVNTDASTTWIIGVDPAYLPHLSPASVPYNAQSKILTLGATFSVTPKSRVYGRFMNMDSQGKTTLSDNWYAGFSTWEPVDVTEKRWTLGYAYDLNKSNTLQVDYSLSDWKDKIDSANDGKFNLWRLAWTRDF